MAVVGGVHEPVRGREDQDEAGACVHRAREIALTAGGLVAEPKNTAGPGDRPRGTIDAGP